MHTCKNVSRLLDARTWLISIPCHMSVVVALISDEGVREDGRHSHPGPDSDSPTSLPALGVLTHIYTHVHAHTQVLQYHAGNAQPHKTHMASLGTHSQGQTITHVHEYTMHKHVHIWFHRALTDVHTQCISTPHTPVNTQTPPHTITTLTPVHTFRPLSHSCTYYNSLTT